MPFEIASESIFILTPSFCSFLSPILITLVILKFRQLLTTCVSETVSRTFKCTSERWRNEQDFVWLHASVSPVTYILIGKLMLLLKERMFWKTWCHLKIHHRKCRLLSVARFEVTNISWSWCFGERGTWILPSWQTRGWVTGQKPKWTWEVYSNI